MKQIIPWGVARIGATWVHSIGNKGQGVKVAILDTGIDRYHEDLKGNYKGGYNFVNNNYDTIDMNGHGSHVAGIVAAEDNDIGVVGVAPKASLYAVNVLDFDGSSNASDIIAGLEWSWENKMDVVNMSLGSSIPSISVNNAVDNAYNSGILMVAAAGNDGMRQKGVGDTIDIPARYGSVISVGALDENNERASFSSKGAELEVSAPGVNIYSTLPRNRYGIMRGTSMSAPHVTGVIALMKAAYPDMTNVQIRVKLDSAVHNIGCRKDLCGYGMVDAVKSVS